MSEHRLRLRFQASYTLNNHSLFEIQLPARAMLTHCQYLLIERKRSMNPTFKTAA